MHDAPRIVRGHIAQYADTTALYVHLDFGKVRGEGIDEMRRTPSRGLGRADDIPRQAGHGSSQVEAPLWHLSTDQLSRFYAYGRRLEQRRSPLQQMAFGILSSEFDRRTTGDRRARPGGDGGGGGRGGMGQEQGD